MKIEKDLMEKRHRLRGMNLAIADGVMENIQEESDEEEEEDYITKGKWNFNGDMGEVLYSPKYDRHYVIFEDGDMYNANMKENGNVLSGDFLGNIDGDEDYADVIEKKFKLDM